MMDSKNSKRIAKNTAMLYIRMILMMGVTLYTSRVVLSALGVEDFGLYNVIGGIIILFSFINNAMVISTQRFLNYELGTNNIEAIKRIFSASVTIHALIALFILIAGETFGLYFLHEYINIPPGRETSACWTYQFSILTACASIIRAPYNALIIAHEKMSFYASISIIEVFLRLGVAFSLTAFAYDRLILYGILMFLVALLVSIYYIRYCLSRFPGCHFSFIKDRELYRRLISFSGWSLFGSMANVGASQGSNIILNIFYGVAVNAAMGIANQVNAAIYSFVSNFQTAFNPQIIKLYAAGERNSFVNIIMSTSKYSYYMLLLISLPVIICCREVLEIWLGTVPMYTTEFCQLMILFSLLDALSGPLWVSVQAIGDIKYYQLIIGGVILLNIPIGYAMLFFGFTPVTVIGLKVMLNAATLALRIIYLKKKINFPAKKYIVNVLMLSVLITILCAPLPYYLHKVTSGLSGVVITFATSLSVSAVIITLLGLTREERRYIKKMIFGK